MEYFWFVDAWSVEYNFDALRIWDDWTDGFVALPAGAAAEVRLGAAGWLLAGAGRDGGVQRCKGC